MESSGACNLKGAVGREAATAAPIIKLLWSPTRESKAERGGGSERREKRARGTRARKPKTRLHSLSCSQIGSCTQQSECSGKCKIPTLRKREMCSQTVNIKFQTK